MSGATLYKIEEARKQKIPIINVIMLKDVLLRNISQDQRLLELREELLGGSVKQQTEVTLPPPVEQVMQPVADPVAPEHPNQLEYLPILARREVEVAEMWSITRKKISALRKELKSERDAGVIGKLKSDINILMKRKAEYAEKMGMGLGS